VRRSGQAFDKPHADRVRCNANYNRNGAGGPLNFKRCEVCHRNYDVGFFIDQFLRQYPEPFRLFVRKAMVQMDVFAFDIAKIVERFYQHTQINFFFLGAARVPEHANNWNFV
jgi:hypothetical protein